jgi:predicted histidine transporter YuiF (NhaC family)
MIVELALILLITSIGAMWFGRMGMIIGFVIGLIVARKYKKKMNDHTDYKKNGKFSLKYTKNSQEKKIVLSDKTWDGLEKILDCLITKIS